MSMASISCCSSMSEFDPWNPCIKARHGDIYLESQCRGGRDRSLSEACWPASPAEDKHSVLFPLLDCGCGYLVKVPVESCLQ